MNWHPTYSIWNEAERKDEALRRSARETRRDESGAAQSTVDALMYSLRRGLAALGQSDPVHKDDTLRRLSELSQEQLVDCCEKLQKRRPPIGPPWTAEEVAALVSAWGKVRPQ